MKIMILFSFSFIVMDLFAQIFLSHYCNLHREGFYKAQDGLVLGMFSRSHSKKRNLEFINLLFFLLKINYLVF